MTTVEENALTPDDRFTYKNGFNVAAAFTAYNGNTEWSLDPSYGELVIKHYAWGEREDGSYFAYRDPRPTHVCSREELGLEEDKTNAKFFPMIESQVSMITTK